jgi:prevent-host-death family protein
VSRDCEIYSLESGHFGLHAGDRERRQYISHLIPFGRDEKAATFLAGIRAWKRGSRPRAWFNGDVREIGIGELRAKLSSVIRGVERGERVRVTRRGRPVADIVPAESPKAAESLPEPGGTMKRLIAEGRVTPATRPPSEAPPASPRKTGRSASAFILAEREEER